VLLFIGLQHHAFFNTTPFLKPRHFCHPAPFQQHPFKPVGSTGHEGQPAGMDIMHEKTVIYFLHMSMFAYFVPKHLLSVV
jgi:hypothetical protein